MPATRLKLQQALNQSPALKAESSLKTRTTTVEIMNGPAARAPTHLIILKFPTLANIFIANR